MARKTYNRSPMSVEMGYYEKQGLRDSYFNLNEFKGLCTDKNYVNVDQQTFSDVDNLYVNYDKELSIRPGLKSFDEPFLYASDDILNFWNLNNILFYHILRNGKYYLICKYNYNEPMLVGQDVFLSEFQTNYIVFYTENQQSKVKGFTIINSSYNEISQESLIYIPNVTEDGDRNVLTSKGNEEGTITSTGGVPANLTGKTTNININGTLYSVLLTNTNNKVIVKNVGSLASLNYTVSNDTSGNIILCYNDDFMYYSFTGEIFYSYNWPSSVYGMSYKQAAISKDGKYVYIVAHGYIGTSLNIRMVTGQISGNPWSITWHYKDLTDLCSSTGKLTEFNTFTIDGNTRMCKYRTKVEHNSVSIQGLGKIKDSHVKGAVRGFVFTVPVSVVSSWSIVTSSKDKIAEYSDPGSSNSSSMYTIAMISMFTYSGGDMWFFDFALLPRDAKFIPHHSTTTSGTLDNWEYSLNTTGRGFSTVFLSASKGNYYNKLFYCMTIWSTNGSVGFGNFVQYFNEIGTGTNGRSVYTKVGIYCISKGNYDFSQYDDNLRGTELFTSHVSTPDMSSGRVVSKSNLVFVNLDKSGQSNAWKLSKNTTEEIYGSTLYNPDNLFNDKVTNVSYDAAKVRNEERLTSKISSETSKEIDTYTVNQDVQYIKVSEDYSLVLSSYFYYNSSVSVKLINTDVGPLRPLVVKSVDSAVHLLYCDKFGIIYSNQYGELKVTVPKDDGTDTIILPDGYLQSFKTVYYKNNKLYFCDESTDVKGQLYWPVKDVFEFSSDINELSVLSDSSFAVYLEDSVWVVSLTSDGLIVKNRSKLQLGVKKGSNVLPLYDGSSTLITTIKGLTALQYQQFVQSTDQVYTYLSENITEDYLKYFESPIQLAQYRDYVFLYNKSENYILMVDFRNGSWWKWTFEYPINKIVTSDKLYLSLNNKIYYLDFLALDFMDYELFPIKWKLKTQKLHFNAPNNYKHVSSVNIVIDREIDNFCYTLKAYNYRNLNSSKYDETFSKEITNLSTSINKMFFIKIHAFQLELSSYENETNSKFVTSNIAIKYRVTERIR